MKEEKNKNIERLERYLFLLKALKDDKIEESLEEKYIKYISLAKKGDNDVKSR